MRIICAAVKVEDKVWNGHRHSHALAAMNDELSYEHSRKEIIEMGKAQGFVTSEGEFVSRREAYQIALKAGQVKHPVEGPIDLYSEDIY